MSYNKWLYVYADPVNLTDPSGHDPWWCEGRYDQDICYANWNIEHGGGKLTAEFLKSYYKVFPDQILRLLQREFHINLPPRYQFRFAFYKSSAFDGPGWFDGPPWSNTLGAEAWFAEINGIEGVILELSSLDQCALLELDASQADRIDYSVYITDRAFTQYKFRPDDVAGTMLHEAVHAWQESIVRDNLDVFLAAFSVDPRTSPWWASYSNGMERQAIDVTRSAHTVGAINLSQAFLDDQQFYRDQNIGGPDFPVDIPIYGLIIR